MLLDVPPCQVLLATGTLERTLDNLSAQPEKRALVVCDATRSDLLLGLSAVHSTEKGPHLAAILLTGAAQLDPAPCTNTAGKSSRVSGFGYRVQVQSLVACCSRSQHQEGAAPCSHSAHCDLGQLESRLTQDPAGESNKVLGFRFQQPHAAVHKNEKGPHFAPSC